MKRKETGGIYDSLHSDPQHAVHKLVCSVSSIRFDSKDDRQHKIMSDLSGQLSALLSTKSTLIDTSDYSPCLKAGASRGRPTLCSPTALIFRAALRSRSIERRQQGQ